MPTAPHDRIAGVQELTLVLVHGAFHGPECFEMVRPFLDEQGVRTIAPRLPLGTLDDDAAAVVATLDAVGGPKLLLGHSYGGAVVSQASAGRDDVAALVYLAALVPDEGESTGELVPEMMDSPIVPALRATDDGRVEVDPALAHSIFYPDTDPVAAAPWVARLRSGDPAGTTGRCGPVGWHDRPVWYVICEDDPIIGAGLQRRFAERAGARVLGIPGDHSPFIARPNELAEALVQIWSDVRVA
jgi:pimeloyl-ACP methyl ester carboxylesterase